MCDHFHLLRQHLVLDTYVAHRAAVPKAAATLCGIELVLIPPGCTDRLQLLDRRVFGVVTIPRMERNQSIE
jgi:hypothetical protein